MEHYKVFDYVNNIISLADKPEDFAKCNFAILCEKYPIQTNRNNYLAKVIYISLQSEKDTWRIYPDKIKEFDIEHVILTTNSRRRLNYKMNEFFVNGFIKIFRTPIIDSPRFDVHHSAGKLK